MSLLDHESDHIPGETEIEKAVREATEATEKKVLANIKAKQHARVLGGGPGAGGPSHSGYDDEDAKLQDTKSHGGAIQVMTERLKQSRQERW